LQSGYVVRLRRLRETGIGYILDPDELRQAQAKADHWSKAKTHRATRKTHEFVKAKAIVTKAEYGCACLMHRFYKVW